MIKAEEIINKQFSRAFWGYDIGEVDEFLDDIVRSNERAEQELEIAQLRIKMLLEELQHYTGKQEDEKAEPEAAENAETENAEAASAENVAEKNGETAAEETANAPEQQEKSEDAEEEKTDAIQTRYTLQTSRLSSLGSVRTEILCKTPGTASGRGAVSVQARLWQPVAEGEQSIPAGTSAVCYLRETGEIHQSHCG